MEMTPRLVSGSWLARTVAVAVTTVAALGLPSTALAQEHPHEPGPGDGLIPEGEWTDEEVGTLLDLIDRTEAALPAFADPAELPDGFYDFGITAPGGYDHYINWEWLDDDHILDPEFPESLVYQHVWNDETQEDEIMLVSAMFFLPTQYTADNIPEELAWYPGWHTHADVCINEQHRFAGLSSGGQCSSGVPFDRPPMMHVWIMDNECGHRFGGIDTGGLHCDVHGGHMPEEPEEPHEPHNPDDPGHDPEHPDDPGQHPEHPDDPGHDMDDPGHDMDDPGHDMGDEGHDHHVPSPATPIHRHPDTAG
jgi:hypothetical protein